MTASKIVHRIRTGLFYDMSQTKKNCYYLDFLTILMANLLVTYGTKALSMILLIIHCNFLIQIRADLNTTKSDV